LDAGPHRLVQADAMTVRVREGGRTVLVHALIAVGVNADGKREILGLDVTSPRTARGGRTAISLAHDRADTDGDYQGAKQCSENQESPAIGLIRVPLNPTLAYQRYFRPPPNTGGVESSAYSAWIEKPPDTEENVDAAGSDGKCALHRFTCAERNCLAMRVMKFIS
jgi:Transposase, Mutator family